MMAGPSGALSKPDESLLLGLWRCRWSFVFEYLRGGRTSTNICSLVMMVQCLLANSCTKKDKISWMRCVGTNPERCFHVVFWMKRVKENKTHYKEVCMLHATLNLWPLSREDVSQRSTKQQQLSKGLIGIPLTCTLEITATCKTR